MTERDLLDFIVQEKKLKKLLDYYKELGDKMSLPKSPNLASIPGGGGDGEERLDLIMDRRTHIKGKIDECRILRDLAEKKLDRAAEILVDELQIDVFDLLYRKGYDVSTISIQLRYTKTHIYRQRTAILNAVASLQ